MKRQISTGILTVSLLLTACSANHGFQTEAYGPLEAANVPLSISETSPTSLPSHPIVGEQIRLYAERNPWLMDLSTDLRDEFLQCLELAALMDPLYDPPDDAAARQHQEFVQMLRMIDQIGSGDLTRLTPHCPETAHAVNSYL